MIKSILFTNPNKRINMDLHNNIINSKNNNEEYLRRLILIKYYIVNEIYNNNKFYPITITKEIYKNIELDKISSDYYISLGNGIQYNQNDINTYGDVYTFFESLNITKEFTYKGRIEKVFILDIKKY